MKRCCKSCVNLELRLLLPCGPHKRLGDGAKGNRIANAYIARFDQDAGAPRRAADIAIQSGDTDRSIAITKRIVDLGVGRADEYNRLAWADLAAGQVTPAALETANNGMSLGSNPPAGLMPTLAVIDAEPGNGLEARAALMQRMQPARRHPAEWR